MYTNNMYTLYKSDDLNEILLQLLKKSRENHFNINILCKNEEIVNNLSNILWNNGIPHWIKDDLYEKQNHIFVSVDIKNVEILIVYDDAFFDEDDANFKKANFIKKIILGTSQNIKGEYWGKQKNGWKKLTHDVFYS